MSDDLNALGVESSDVPAESTGRNVAVVVVGLVLAVAALIPLTWGAIWVGTYVWAAVATLTGGSGDPASL